MSHLSSGAFRSLNARGWSPIGLKTGGIKRYQPTSASAAACRIVISSSCASFAGAGASRITLALCSLDYSCIRPDAFEESPNERRKTPTHICIDRESNYRTRVSYAEESRIACHLCFLASVHLPRFTSSVFQPPPSNGLGTNL